MSAPANLQSLNWDVLLEIVKHDLDGHDLFTLAEISKQLNSLARHKSPWIALLKRLSQTHPLPISPCRDLSTFSVAELQSIAIKATNLHENWLSRNPKPRPSYKIVSLPQHDVVVSMLLVPHWPYIIALMRDGLVACLDIDTGNRIAHFRPDGFVSSWRLEPLDERNVTVVLLVGPEDRSTISHDQPAEFVVLRFSPPETSTMTRASFSKVASYPVNGPVTGIFTTSQVAGLVSVNADTNTATLLVSRVNQSQDVIIDTGIPVATDGPSGALNAVAQSDDLMLYSENVESASVYTYHLKHGLLSLLDASEASPEPRLFPPTTRQTYKLRPEDLCEDSHGAYTILRTRWQPWQNSDASSSAGRSLLSILTMSFVLGQDPNGTEDHRCVSHAYLDPFKGHPLPSEGSSGRISGNQSQESPSLGYSLAPPLTPSHSPASSSSTLTPSPSISIASTLADETPSGHLIRRGFHSCLEEKGELWQGPGRNDLISVGYGASHALWVAITAGGAVLKLASLTEPQHALPRIKRSAQTSPAELLANHGQTALFSPLQNSSGEEYKAPAPYALRTLQLPASLNALEITSLTLDDVSGIVALSTTRQEIWILDYAVAPSP